MCTFKITPAFVYANQLQHFFQWETGAYAACNKEDIRFQSSNCYPNALTSVLFKVLEFSRKKTWKHLLTYLIASMASVRRDLW